MICCYEKKCAGLMKESAHSVPVNQENTFTVKFDADNNFSSKWNTRMHILITNGFVKGYYQNTDFNEQINIIGAINSSNEIILIESGNGKIMRTFQGKYQKEGKGTILLSGIWESTNDTNPTRFFGNARLYSDRHEAFSLISKKQ